MEKYIKTKTVARNVAKTNNVVIEKTPNTRLIFSSLIHNGGVRGVLIRLKKKEADKWEVLKIKNFAKHNLLPGEKIEIVLTTATLKKLLDEVSCRQDIVSGGIKYGHHEYITVEKNKAIVIDDRNKKELLEQIISKGYSDDFWNLISDSNPSLADKLSAIRLQIQRKKVIDDLKNRLKQVFSETKGDDSWQNWIYKNNWLFGANYHKPIEKQRININGIMPDYLFPTVDGFVDILEIKLPSFEVIEEDANHKGSWVWSKESNNAIGQVVNYLSEVQDFRFAIERLLEKESVKGISLLKPRAFILIGQNDGWNKDKKEGLRKLNHALHGIEIITYSDIVKRGEMFIESSFPQITEDEFPF